MGSQISGQVSIDGEVHVVIVGGGFGGIAAGNQLKSKGIPFTLIDVRDAFHHNVAALRASVQSGFARQTFIPYKETFGESFRQGHVVRLDPAAKVVVLEGEQEIHYTHLILCTGSSGPFPGNANTEASYQAAIQKYEEFVKEIQQADSVLVIGGGSTGVEMAAEVKTEYPKKKVVLVHSHMSLADPDLLPSVRQQVKEVLEEKEVEILLGQKVSNLSELQFNVARKDTTVLMNDGTKVLTDLIICCAGNRINSAAYRSSLAECLAKNEALKVNEHLQVVGYNNIYAVGDCADVSEPKLGYHAGLHAGVAVTNIVNSLTGKPLTSYKTGNVTMLLAMGRNDGVGQFSGFHLPRFVVTMSKSKGLMLWKSWYEMGQKAPEEAPATN